MTELGRNARWGTAAVVAPLAAVALAAATTWGVAHPPAASGKNTSADKPSVAGPPDRAVAPGQQTAGLDKSRLALQQQASTEQARVIRLQKILNGLNAHTRAVARAPLPGFSGGSSTVRSASTGGTVTVAAPPRLAAAPAPATHTSTGAS
jgi:hypothetical protein